MRTSLTSSVLLTLRLYHRRLLSMMASFYHLSSPSPANVLDSVMRKSIIMKLMVFFIRLDVAHLTYGHSAQRGATS